MNLSRNAVAVVVLAISLAVFCSAAAGMSFRMEPFHTHFFLFAWWPYIFGMESLLTLMGGFSTLYERPRSFWLSLPLSLTLWLAFEAVNFRLGNWHYIGVPASLPVRWTGYVLAYATVLPALSVTGRFLEYFGLWEDVTWKELGNASRLRWPMVALGVACLVLPLAWPRYFFPLVWGAPIFLLEPWLYACGARSHLRLLATGRPRRLLLALAAGLICGGLWECWNFRAGAKWYYTVPFVDVLHVFEMPILGFLGFPPFAVACDVVAAAFRHLRRHMAFRPERVRRVGWGVIALAAVLFDVAVMIGIDTFTVDLFR
ncbi:hypothetical protein GGQ74_001306 [Desulfobaculum xiamenense]|uniref:Uncharacterized protein n=1 Tax=Desulfobaculum xiamenense TaxID=995050 RepID=A0A846QFU5_9BACT|nr:hypothetical protein [Desulfobaculum xiamenense]NJB67666.1 hypothetical protein [Desulfobaculum xiamenense]